MKTLSTTSRPSTPARAGWLITLLVGGSLLLPALAAARTVVVLRPRPRPVLVVRTPAPRPAVIRPIVRAVVKPAKKVWVPGHWTVTPRGVRVWVRGHYRLAR
jgi:hypothetical protein